MKRSGVRTFQYSTSYVKTGPKVTFVLSCSSLVHFHLTSSGLRSRLSQSEAAAVIIHSRPA
jgi:hypothetical protein